MKHIFLITLSFLFSSISIAQNSDVLQGTWQKQTSNQIFRIELERETGQYEDGSPSSIILGHFQIIELDANGNEIIILNSDQTINPNTPNSFQLPHAIRGGVYNYKSDDFLFYFTDINGVIANLRLKIVTTNANQGTLSGNINRLQWKLITGWYKGGELNVPENVILDRVN